MKKNIFFLLPVFTYGAGQSIKRIILKLDNKKYNKNIICLGKCQFKKELKEKKINIFELNYSKLIFAIGDIKKILNQNKFDKKILISNIHYTNVLSLIFLSSIDNLKIIVNERTAIKELDICFGFIDFFKKKIIKLLIKVYYKRADVVIANSTKSSADLSAIIGGKVLTIFSPSFIKSYYSKKQKKNKKKNLIVVSRLSKEKNIMYLLKAINLIKNQDFILRLLGEGEQKKFLIAYVLKNKLSHKVKFLNYKRDVIKYLIKSDLFINTSFFEGFPNSVVESLSCNTPVICSKSHGGIFDIIKNNKYGHLFELNKIENLSALILKFLNNDQSFIDKTKKSKNNLKRFTIEKCVNKYDKLFDSL